MQQHSQSIVTPPVLTGHVFARQQLFMTLPKNLQQDAKQFRAYVEQDKSRLFENHRHALVKSVYSVKGKDLIDTVTSWLHARYAPTAKTTPVLGLEPAWEVPNGIASTKAPASSMLRLELGLVKPHDVTKEQLEAAKQVAEALVLMGFITPYKEDDTHLTSIAPDHYIHDSELLIPIAPSVTDLTTTTVWSVADGAVYACSLKRKAGLLGKLTNGKDVYVVFNDKTKKAYLFESDLAREPISELSGATLDVQFDNSHFQFGVRVSLSTGGVETDTPELFNAETDTLQEELMNAFLGIGAEYQQMGVRKPENADSSGFIASEGLPPNHKSTTHTGNNQSTEPMANLVAASVGFPSASHAKTSQTDNSAASSTSTSTKYGDRPMDAHATPHVAP